MYIYTYIYTRIYIYRETHINIYIIIKLKLMCTSGHIDIRVDKPVNRRSKSIWSSIEDMQIQSLSASRF